MNRKIVLVVVLLTICSATIDPNGIKHVMYGDNALEPHFGYPSSDSNVEDLTCLKGYLLCKGKKWVCIDYAQLTDKQIPFSLKVEEYDFGDITECDEPKAESVGQGLFDLLKDGKNLMVTETDYNSAKDDDYFCLLVTQNSKNEPFEKQLFQNNSTPFKFKLKDIRLTKNIAFHSALCDQKRQIQNHLQENSLAKSVWYAVKPATPSAPFYKTTWFILLVILGLLALAHYLPTKVLDADLEQHKVDEEIDQSRETDDSPV